MADRARPKAAQFGRPAMADGTSQTRRPEGGAKQQLVVADQTGETAG